MFGCKGCSYLTIKQKMPDNWYVFMKDLSRQSVNSDYFYRKIYAIFQIVYYLSHNVSKKTPLRVSIAEAIHSECRSKKLITIE